jgi:ABC-type nitrate/sulfonate/bicarbonate transport system substrate-binding protein
VQLIVNGFGGAADLPVWIAQEHGLFAAEGLAVKFQQTRGSVAQFQDLMAGRFQIASTLFDNVVGYAEQQGEVALDPPSDAFAFMGSHFGINSLVVAPDIADLAALKGRTVAVDAVSTGYAFMLFRILEDAGLVQGRDYRAIAVGSPPGRFAALKDGRAQAALLAAPADLIAVAQGFKVLTDTARALGPCQAGVYAARRGWAVAHRAEIVRFVRAMVAAHASVFDDRSGAIAVLRKRLPSLAEPAAEGVWRSLTGPGGFDRAARIDPAAARFALALRRRYGRSPQGLGDVDRYADGRFHAEALAGRAPTSSNK